MQKGSESEKATKPNLRFDMGVEIDGGTTFVESVIKSKVKELEKAMSVDKEDVTMGESHAQKDEFSYGAL